MSSRGNTATSVDQPQEAAEQDEDGDALLASLEEEDDSQYRAQRVQELKAETGTSRSGAAMSIDTVYMTLKGDDEALHFTTEHERAVVHFFYPEFARCSIMDNHCRQIAAKHSGHETGDVSFARVDVKDAPFVVEKLSVRVLPCVIGFVKGVAKGRITGFEGICWDGREDGIVVTRAIEQTFVDWSIFKKRLLFGHDDEDHTDEDDDSSKQRQSGRRGIQGRKQHVDDDDDDWD